MALYALILLTPLSGYLHSAAGKHEFSWFWLVPVPDLVAPDKSLDHTMGMLHYALAIALGAVLVAHVGATIWHAGVKHDGVLTRMWPGFQARSSRG
jgi:cytochrome b561